MLVDEDFQERLKELGLNGYEVKIWTALLSRGVSTAGELSDIANVPRSRSYDVLESLEKKGFVVMKIGKPIKYIAVPPKEAINRVKRNIEKKADKKSDRIENLKDSEIIEELKLLHKEGVEKKDPAEVSSHVKGSETVKDRANELIQQAEDKIVIATQAKEFNKEYPRIKKSLYDASNKGIDIRIACKNLDLFKKEEEVEEIAEIKNLDVDARFWIIDEHDVLFSITGPNKHDFENAISINTPFFSRAMEDLFEKAWQTT